MSTVQDKLVRAISAAVAQLGKGTNEPLAKAFASFREMVHSRFGQDDVLSVSLTQLEKNPTDQAWFGIMKRKIAVLRPVMGACPLTAVSTSVSGL